MDNRGVSSPLSYAIVLAISVLLSTGLLIGTSTYVNTQQNRYVEQGFRQESENLKQTIQTLDTIIQRENKPDSFEITVLLKYQIGGKDYNININQESGEVYEIKFESQDSEVEFETSVISTVELDQQSALSGGKIKLEYKKSENKVVIKNG